MARAPLLQPDLFPAPPVMLEERGTHTHIHTLSLGFPWAKQTAILCDTPLSFFKGHIMCHLKFSQMTSETRQPNSVCSAARAISKPLNVCVRRKAPWLEMETIPAQRGKTGTLWPSLTRLLLDASYCYGNLCAVNSSDLACCVSTSPFIDMLLANTRSIVHMSHLGAVIGHPSTLFTLPRFLSRTTRRRRILRLHQIAPSQIFV